MFENILKGVVITFSVLFIILFYILTDDCDFLTRILTRCGFILPLLYFNIKMLMYDEDKKCQTSYDKKIEDFSFNNIKDLFKKE